jgi:sugar-specific transcriptional regulator TrmB
MLEDEFVNGLMNLGLTLIQAKAYLALCRLENATIRTISKTSNLARQDVYRILPTLEKLGLAEQIIGTPTKYKATPIKTGISTLLLHKTQKHTELQKKTSDLLTNLSALQQVISREVVLEEDPQQQFVVTREVHLLIQRLVRGTRAAKVSIDSVGTWESFIGVVSHGCEDFEDALNRGVRIRSITENPGSEKTLPNCVKALKKRGLYELRFLPAPIPATMSILDNTEVNISISKPTSKGELHSLWSNNSTIVTISASYFEKLWRKASAFKSKEDMSVLIQDINE